MKMSRYERIAMESMYREEDEKDYQYMLWLEERKRYMEKSPSHFVKQNIEMFRNREGNFIY